MDEAEAARLDALRRRLYAPGTTEADLAAYRAAEQAVVVAAPAAERRIVRSRSLRRRILVAAGAAVLVVGGGSALVVGRPLAAISGTGPSASPTVAAAIVDEAELPASATDRATFVRVLQAGDDPGLLTYLYEHPGFLPPSLRTQVRAASTEYSGQGTSTIALDPSDLTRHGGRVSVILVLDRAGTYSWRAQRIAQTNDRSGPVVELGAKAGTGRAGEPTSATFRYSGTAPARLALYVDETVKWGAVVVFTD